MSFIGTKQSDVKETEVIMNKTVKNILINTVKNVCGTAHITFKYGMDASEQLEASAMKRLTGEDPKEVVKERRARTELKQLEHKEMFQRLQKTISDSRTVAVNKLVEVKDSAKAKVDDIHETIKDTLAKEENRGNDITEDLTINGLAD